MPENVEIDWVPIQRIVYAAIYLEHENALTVFGAHTCHDGQCEWHGETHIYTEWGFKGADVPLIRSVQDGKEVAYAMASVRVRPDGD